MIEELPSVKKYLTEPQAAEALNVSVRTMQTYRTRRIIDFVKIGNAIYYRPDQIAIFLERCVKKSIKSME
jgi:hypothetical protein